MDASKPGVRPGISVVTMHTLIPLIILARGESGLVVYANNRFELDEVVGAVEQELSR